MERFKEIEDAVIRSNPQLLSIRNASTIVQKKYNPNLDYCKRKQMNMPLESIDEKYIDRRARATIS